MTDIIVVQSVTQQAFYDRRRVAGRVFVSAASVLLRDAGIVGDAPVRDDVEAAEKEAAGSSNAEATILKSGMTDRIAEVVTSPILALILATDRSLAALYCKADALMTCRSRLVLLRASFVDLCDACSASSWLFRMPNLALTASALRSRSADFSCCSLRNLLVRSNDALSVLLCAASVVRTSKSSSRCAIMACNASASSSSASAFIPDTSSCVRR